MEGRVAAKLLSMAAFTSGLLQVYIFMRAELPKNRLSGPESGLQPKH
jgi:hypothetical protein